MIETKENSEPSGTGSFSRSLQSKYVPALLPRLAAVARTIVVLAVGFFLVERAQGAAPNAYLIVHSDPSEDEFRYQGHAENMRLALRILRNGFRVYWLAESNESSTSNVPLYRRGDFLIPLDQPDRKFLQFLLEQTASPGVQAVSEKITASVYPLDEPTILVDAQSWASNYYWYYDTLTTAGFSFEHLYQHEANSFDPQRHNLFVVPGGGGDIPAGYNDLLRGYVSGGGNFIGSCWGAIQALQPSEASGGSGNGAGIAEGLNTQKIRSFGALGGYGPIVLKNEAPGHPVMWDLPSEIRNIYWNGPVMQPTGGARSLASFHHVVEPDFFFHRPDRAARKLDYTEEIGKSIYMVSQREGEGRVVLFGSHPEATSSVSPFEPFAMGNKALYNSILFATAGPLQSHTLSDHRPSAEDANLGSKQKIYLPEKDRLEQIRRQVRGIKSSVVELIEDRKPSYTEDDRSGFFLLRLSSALTKVEQRLSDIKVVAAGGARGKDLQTQIEKWMARAEEVYPQLEQEITKIDPIKMNSWSFRWCPVVGPAYESSATLSHLNDDIDLHNRFCRRP